MKKHCRSSVFQSTTLVDTDTFVCQTTENNVSLRDIFTFIFAKNMNIKYLQSLELGLICKCQVRQRNDLIVAEVAAIKLKSSPGSNVFHPFSVNRNKHLFCFVSSLFVQYCVVGFHLHAS